ncbi:MAG: ChaN family lipoprotein, partial [Thalassovita sp.]|nr:ChaN family lipoprotein [Thalassovita sp.]
RAAFDAGIVESFGDDAAEYGLDRPLPEDQQQARIELQKAAHCDALPENLLPKMVELQRLRDAVLARTTLRALAETGGPVVVITGNGHARTDWGVPHALKRRQPGLNLLSIGQSEDGMGPEGSFDTIVDAPAVDRPDPCAAFR